ncbi:hypothetical protein [uncultured Victivallis sp.]|uniref:hypothetical protein n=1 Tax=Victivallis sp. TaxID=2049020 RepID=UPI0025DA108F|nr:hypothetical protein [uncultured Victivallis sp.]
MKFHRYVTALFGALALAFLATGCTIPVMATGKYAAEDSGREDYAVVYQDKIFLHIKAPELYNGRASYWDWAGKYELTSAGEIRPDMDRETAKLWNFYYTFLSKREGIVVNDLSENKGYLLRFQPTAKRPVIQSAMPLDDAEPMQ